MTWTHRCQPMVYSTRQTLGSCSSTIPSTSTLTSSDKIVLLLRRPSSCSDILSSACLIITSRTRTCFGLENANPSRRRDQAKSHSVRPLRSQGSRSTQRRLPPHTQRIPITRTQPNFDDSPYTSTPHLRATSSTPSISRIRRSITVRS